MKLMGSKKMLLAAGGLLGLVAVVLAVSGNPANMAICVACFIRDTAGAMKLHQAPIVQYVRPEIAGIVLGAFVISLATKEYRSTSGSSPMIRFLLGMIMMLGALIFLGCPLRMLIRMSAGDLNAYVALPGFIAGIWTGTLALKRGFSLGRAYETKPSNGFVLPVLLTVVLILSVTTALFAFSEQGPGSMHAPVLISLTAGLIFGIISQKCRTCFAGSVRDVILMKNFDLMAIIGGFFLVMTVYNIASGNFQFSFTGQPIAHSMHLWNFLGLYAVGFAATLAGGCPLRQLVLTGQGSGDAAVTFFGLLVGAAVCHNFGLVGSAAAAATDGAPAVLGGPAMAGKAALLAAIAVLFLIGFAVKKKEKQKEK